MAFAAVIDRLNAACERTFGEPATLNGAPITGIFQAPYAESFGMAMEEPTFRTRSQHAAQWHGATLVVAAGSYRVRSAQPDGTGWVLLRLEQA